jgi:hypothetical protein
VDLLVSIHPDGPSGMEILVVRSSDMSQAGKGYGTFRDTVLGGSCDPSACLPIPVVTGARCDVAGTATRSLDYIRRLCRSMTAGQQKRKGPVLCAQQISHLCLHQYTLAWVVDVSRTVLWIACHQPAIRFAITLFQPSFLEGSGWAACISVRRRRRLPFHSGHGNT